MQPTGFNLPYQQNSYYPTYQAPQTWLPTQQSYPQGVPQKASIFGKLISDESQILPSDVPMDGSISIFPLQDYSKIFAKQWTKNGTIQTMVYIPQMQEEPSTSVATNDFTTLTSHIDSKFDELMSVVSNRQNHQNKQKTYRKDNTGDENA